MDMTHSGQTSPTVWAKTMHRAPQDTGRDIEHQRWTDERFHFALGKKLRDLCNECTLNEMPLEIST